jgi:glycosidase
MDSLILYEEEFLAKDTPKTYRNLNIYQVYVRNHGPNGTFADVEADLPRIRDLGFDIVYFLPIHPIGKLNKKGSLGCPFSIVDYEDVNPQYGTKEDFGRLITRAHALDLKVMIDVVYNHTAHDSRLVDEHPNWFHQNEDGEPVTTVPDWSDVIDLKHPNPELSDYLIGVLRGWAKFGVDGFRCDVASLLPAEFWIHARQEVAKVKPNVIWMAESVHTSFVVSRRTNNLNALSDGQLYPAFDILYDYDIWPIWEKAVSGELPVSRYLEMLYLQEGAYPENYVKMRCVENHDQPRIMARAPSRAQALAWTALIAFNKGPFFVYAGQEAAETKTPSLFDIDKVFWGTYELSDFIRSLTRLKKDPAQMYGKLIFTASRPAVQAVWYTPETSLFGVFNVSSQKGKVSVLVPDGVYVNLLDNQNVKVSAGKMLIPPSAVVLQYPSGGCPQPVNSF